MPAQLWLHPSPPFVLPSSQASRTLRSPSPQPGGGGELSTGAPPSVVESVAVESVAALHATSKQAQTTLIRINTDPLLNIEAPHGAFIAAKGCWQLKPGHGIAVAKQRRASHVVWQTHTWEGSTTEILRGSGTKCADSALEFTWNRRG